MVIVIEKVHKVDEEVIIDVMEVEEMVIQVGVTCN